MRAGKGFCTRFGFFLVPVTGLRSQRSHMFALLHIHIASHMASWYIRK